MVGHPHKIYFMVMTMSFEPKLGAFLRDRRMALGLTQAEVGEKLGYTSQFIANWERNASTPPASRLFEVIQVLAIDEIDLLEILTTDSMGHWKAAIRSAQQRICSGN
jgi:transcriptional regulator with XRE-family HTH domain